MSTLMINNLFDFSKPIVFGVAAYFVTAVALAVITSRHHIKGDKLSKQGKYPEALNEYQMSYTLFSKYPLLDKFRTVLMLTYSKVSYREMALCAIGNCFKEMGDSKAAFAYYRRAIYEFPKSGRARTALELLNIDSSINQLVKFS